MEFKEWVKDDSLFHEINDIRKFPFIKEYDSETLDLLYTSLYGRHTVPKNIENLDVSDVAHLIVISFGKKWEQQHELLHEELMLGVERKTQTDETGQDETKQETKSDRQNKVSAYNDDEMITSDGSQDETTDSTDKESNKNTETTETSFKTVKEQLELLNSSFIRETVFQDIRNMLSLSIH